MRYNNLRISLRSGENLPQEFTFQVVTTSGPRKPQRQCSNAFSTASNDNVNVNPYDDNGPASLRTTRSQSNLSHSITLSPTFQNKVYLETSFTNLQSPNKFRSYENSHKTSPNVSGGRMSSMHCDISMASAIDSSIASVIRRSPSFASDTATVVVNGAESEIEQKNKFESHYRPKAVVFDMKPHNGCDGGATSTRTPSPQNALTRSILQRQSSTHQVRKKPNMLQFPPLRRASLTDNERSVDLLHDDWFGLAPLASPETLSEISSISSRTTSASISLANSIERYFQNSIAMKENNEQKQILDDIYESQLITPKVMRRAPKFRENLSTCAENSKNIDQYKRFGRVFITCPQLLPDQGNNVDSSDDSFKSAQSTSNTLQANGKCFNREKDRYFWRTDSDQEATTRGIEEDRRDSRSSNEPDSVLSVETCPAQPISPTPYSCANLSSDQCSTKQSTILESHFPVTDTSPMQNTGWQSEEDPIALSERRWLKRLSSEEIILPCNDKNDTQIIQILDNYMGPSSFSGYSSLSRKRKGCVYPAHNGNFKVVTQATKHRNDSPSVRSRPSCSDARSRSHESSV